MKTKILISLFLYFLFLNSFSQEIENINYIKGTINVPLIVNETMIVDDFKYNQFDKTTINEDTQYSISTSLNYIPLIFSPTGYHFNGTLIEVTEYYNIITTVKVYGFINAKTKLGSITVTETRTQKKGDYEENYSTTYRYENLKINSFIHNTTNNRKLNTYHFLPQESTTVSVEEYIYWNKTSNTREVSTHEITFVKIDEKKLKEDLKPGFPYFNFSISWDGKTIDDILRESTTITQIRGVDPNWESPSTPYLNEGIETEPNSVAIYFDNAGLDEVSKSIAKGYSSLIVANLSKVPSLKILERGKIDKIIQEIKLSESGLVKEESLVKNNLMKEEMAVIIKTDLKNKTAKCTIMSKNKELSIDVINFKENKIFDYLSFFVKLISKEINEQFDLDFDVEKVLFPTLIE